MHEAVFFAVKDSFMKNDRPNEMHLKTSVISPTESFLIYLKRITAFSLIRHGG